MVQNPINLGKFETRNKKSETNTKVNFDGFV